MQYDLSTTWYLLNARLEDIFAELAEFSCQHSPANKLKRFTHIPSRTLATRAETAVGYGARALGTELKGAQITRVGAVFGEEWEKSSVSMLHW